MRKTVPRIGVLSFNAHVFVPHLKARIFSAFKTCLLGLSVGRHVLYETALGGESSWNLPTAPVDRTRTRRIRRQMSFFWFQCLFSVRTTLKVCKLGERILEGSSASNGGGGGGGYLNEESVLDLGKALYKLHLQLLLLLEAVAKMYITLSNSAADNKVSRVKRSPCPPDDKTVSHCAYDDIFLTSQSSDTIRKCISGYRRSPQSLPWYKPVNNIKCLNIPGVVQKMIHPISNGNAMGN